MKKLHRGRLLLSTCLTGIALASASGALAQDRDPTWQPRAEVDARAADGTSQVSFELFTPVAQNDTNLMFVSGRIGYDEQFDRNGSVTFGGRGKVGEDIAIGVNAGVDFYKSNISKRDQTAVSFGLEGFTSVFDVRLNYRLPVTNRRTIGYLDPNASPVGTLLVENNRLIERKAGWRLEDVPLGGANAEIGATVPVGKSLSVRASAAGFDYRDDAASKAYRGVRGALELGVEDPLGTGGRFTIGAELQNDNRWGTQARGTLRLSIPLGGGSRDRSAGNRGLDRQMGDRVRRDYVTPSSTRYTDLTSNSFAIDARTGNEFGGIYYVNGSAAAAGAGSSASPTTLADAVTRAGANGVVVAMGNAGNITSGGVTLATNQYLVGGASSVNVRHSNGTVSAFSFGSSNGTIVGSNAGGAAVTLGQGSVVRDVVIRGSGSGILANGVGGFALERVIIENTGGAGLTLTNTIGAVAIDGITIRGAGGTGLVVNGGNNFTLRNSIITAATTALDINDAGGNLTASLSNLTLSASGGNVLDIDGSGAGTVTVAGLSGIFIAGGNGETGGFAARNVTFDSSSAAGIQTVNAGTMQMGSTSARVNGAGVSLTEVDGALSFGALNITNNAGTGLTVNNTKTGTFTLSSAAGAIDTTAGTALNLDPLRIDLTFASVRSSGAAGAGIILDNVQGTGTGGNALNIGTLAISDSGQQGLFITGGSTGVVTIGSGTVTNSGSASVQIGEAGIAGSGGTIGLNFGAAITDNGAGPLASIFNTGGALRFTGAIAGAGPITIDGTTAGSSIVFGGNTAISGSATTALSINNIAGSVGFAGTLAIANPTGSGIVIGNSAAGSNVFFAGATTIAGASSPALSLNNLAGSTAFSGALSIVNPAGTAIVIGVVPGGVAFGDVDITGLGAGTGLNLTGTSGNVTFGTLDITGTGIAGSTGIDLSNAGNAGAVTILNPSVIQGVDIGANLTNAHMTGSFRYGDGDAADGLESRITANTVIVVAGLNATQGTYNFADVQLDGNTNNITGGSFTTYYVLAGATGMGTAGDPGSIAGAAASGAQYIVLLNDPNGGRDVIDTAGLSGGALSLAAGQSLVSFLNTDFFAVTGATVPANLIVSNLGPTGIANTFAGSGAAILTSSLGASTVNLANDTRIDGVVINNDALGTGIFGSGVSNVIIRNSTISGNGGAISITDGGAAASLTLTNLNLASTGGVALALNGTGAGTVNVSGTGINITATGTGQGLAIDDVTVGALDIGSITTGTAAGANGAVYLNQVAGGTVNIGSVTVGGASVGAGFTVANSAAAVSIGATSVANTAGGGVFVQNNSGAVTIGPVSVANSGGTGLTVSGNTGSVALGTVTVSSSAGHGVSLLNNGGNLTLGAVAVSNGTGDGVRLVGNGSTTLGQLTLANIGGTGLFAQNISGNLNIAGAAITGAAGGGVTFQGASATSTISIGALSVSAGGGTGIALDDIDGAATFTGATTIANSNGIRFGAGSTGTIRFGDVDITGLGVGMTGVDARNASGTVSFATLDIIGTSTSGTRGIDMTGATLAGTFTVADSSAIAGVGTGVDLTNAAITGSFRYGDGSNTDSDGAHSAINAITPITVGGINQTVGTYDFADVALNGDTTGLVTNPISLFFVEQGRNGIGTKTDPGSLTAALASSATVIVLLNNPTGGNDTLDVAGLGTFTLDANQRLIGFLNGDSQNVGGGTPTNMILYGLASGIVTNPYAGSGAGLLTNTGGGATVTLANGASIDGLRIGGAGIGVSGVGVSNVSITNSIISGSAGAILLRDGGAAASATLSNLALSGTSGMVLDLLGTNGGSLTLRGSGISIAATGNARGLAMDTITLGANFGLTSVSTQTSAGPGVALNNIGGPGGLSFTNIGIGGTSAGAGIALSGNSATIGLGTVTVANTAGNGVEILGNAGNVAIGTFAITGATATGLRIEGMQGAFTALGGSITGGATGLSLADIDGSVTFTGGLTIANPGNTGISLGLGSTGAISFGDVDITGLGANGTGLNARNASGNVTFGTFDIAGASVAGTRGIDLTGATFGGNLIVSGSSTITGVGTGVDLTNGAITGNFRFGDGSNTDANGAGSTINATTPLIAGGLNGATGTYNFADVNLTGDTSSLATSSRVYWALAGGSGAGTRIDPGSLAGAAASGADIIILLNNPAGGNDTFDAAGLGTFALAANQRLLGFLNGDSQTVGGGMPANLVLYNVVTGVVTNPFVGSGSGLLTNTGGGATVTLANGASIDGLRIGGAGIGVSGIGVSNVSITNSIISGGAGAILLRDGGTAASATLSNLALSGTGGTVLDLLGTNGGSLTLRGSGISIAATGNARGLSMDSVTLGANLGFGTVSTLMSAGSGVALTNVGGAGGLSFASINVGGTTSQSGVYLSGNSAAINLGNVTVANTSIHGIDINNNPGNVTLGTFNISNTAMAGLLAYALPGSFTAAGGTITNSGTMGIAIAGIDGSATFTGGVTITNPGSTGITLGRFSSGTISFADVDIIGLAAGKTGLDARIASGNTVFGTLDISGVSATGTRGIDLTGATFAGNLTIAGSSTITGVGTGVDLTNAAITGNFRFGDGSNTDANGAASTINATIPLVVTGLNSAIGTYNFADVNLIGDTSSLATSAKVYWVLAGASGAGTRGNPGSLAGAAASGADIIVLLNNPVGGNDTLNAADPTYGTGGTFTLMTGQQLRGFLYGDVIALPGGAPANVTLYNVATGTVTNPFAGSGAPTLTTTAGGGADTVRVNSGALIDGVIIANGGTGTGVVGRGAANVTIRNSIISGADSAIDFSDNGAAASLALSNLRLWASNNSITLAVYKVGAGSTTITELSDITIEGGHGEAGGAYFFGASFDADLATAGYQTVNASLTAGTAAARVNGQGVTLTNATGALNFTNLSIYNQSSIGLSVGGMGLALSSVAGTVDTVNSTTLSINGSQTDLVLDRVVHSGMGAGVAVTNGLTGIGTGGRALQVGALNVTSASTNGISIGGNVNGLISFGAGSSIAGTSGSAISISSGTGTLGFTYNGSVSQANNAALLSVAGHNGTITFGAGSTLSATNGTGLQFDNADGIYAFNGTTTLNGGDAGIDILNGSAGSFTFANASITSPTGIAINIADSTASLSYTGNVTQANNAALLSVLNHSGGTITFLGGTLGATNGTGLQFDNADGTYAFNGTMTLNGGDAGIDVLNGSAGSFTFGAGTTITSPTGAAISIADSTASLSYAGNVTQASNAAVLSVLNHSGGTIRFLNGTLGATNGAGLRFSNADGTYLFNGTTTLNGGSAGISILTNSAGNFAFGSSTTITNPFGPAFAISNSTAGVIYSGTVNQADALSLALSVSTHSTGTLDFSGATLNVTGGHGLTFNDADGTYNFGNMALSGGASLRIINGSAGAFTFGNVDITGLLANTTAVNLTGATGNVTFATLDIAAASTIGTRGIDMTGSTTAGNVIVGLSSTMTGLGIGVDLTNAAITGNFRYGDGSNTDANGAGSSISAVTPLVIGGLNGGTGTYNFADVNMVGDTTNLSVSAYFVLEGATGIGTRSDPGSLAGAEAANATYIVLLNNPTGGNDILDATAGAGGSFDLDGGQILYSFRDTDSFTVGGGAPANIVLYNVQTGVISNPFAGSGAPTLTASGGNATLTLGGSNIIDGVIIANSGTGAGILGNGVGGTLTIRNSTIAGGAAGAMRIYDNAANVLLGLNNLTLAANGGNILNLDGTGAGSFTLTQLANLNVMHTTETGGFVISDVVFDSDTLAAGLQAVNAGALTLGTTGARITGDGLSLTNVTGTLNFSDLNIANTGGTGLIVANSKTNNFTLGTTGGAIDTTNGTAINLDPLTINMVLNSVNASGGAYGILLDQLLGSFTVTGAVNVNGATNTAIAVRDNTALGVQFQGAVAINNTTGAGVSLTNNSGATVDFTSGLGITTTTGTGFAASGGGTISVSGSGNTITTGDAGALVLNGVTVAAGGVTFDQITSAPGLATAVSLVNTNLTGALNIRGLDVVAVNSAVVFNNLTGTGGVNLTGTIDIDSGFGFTFAGSLGTINIANTAGSSLTIDGGQSAIRSVGVTGGIVNVASAAGSAAINGSTGSAIDLSGDTGGTLNYGGTINTTQGSVLNVANSVADVTLSGAMTSTSAGTAFRFGNADGTYTISGNVSHTGGAGVAINAASAGGILFSGASKTFSTGANTAITTTGTGSLSFTGGGLGITTTTGTGFTATGGGTVLVHGANNTIASGNATALSLNGVALAPGGVTFQNISATPAAAIAVNIDTVALNGALSIGGLTVSGTGTAARFANLNGGGGVNLTGTIDIDGGTGFEFAGALGTINIAEAAGSTLTIDGASTAILFNGVTSGDVNVGLSGGNASIGATTSSTTAAIGMSGGTGGLLSYGGTIRATAGAALSVTNSSSLATLTGATTSTSANSLFNFVNADGTYSVTGTVSHTGGAGVAVDAASSGAITFSGASKAFNSGASTAISMAGSGTLSFTGGGLDIDTTSGTGFSATGGTLVVTGANNRIDTTTGQILGLSGVTGGAGGINFASLTATGTVANNGILLSNLTGAAFNGGTVSIANGTSGAANDGIKVTTGTAAITFGNTTIGLAGSNAIELLNSGSAVTFGTMNLAGANGSTVVIAGSTGPVTLGTGTIAATDAANYAVSVTGGTGDVSVGSALVGTNMVQIVDHETGTVTFSGDMASTVSGISVTNVNSGLIRFTGQTLALNATSAGVTLAGNSGGTIDFNPTAGGNGLDIVSSGSGFSAGPGGTVIVRGSGNSISTTGTGTALSLQNVTIGASGFTFDGVSANGATTGILIIGVDTVAPAIGLGTVNLQGITSRGIDIAGIVPVGLTITDLDIGLNSNSAVALDFNGATLSAPIMFGDFDVTNAGGAGTSIAVDLRGTLGGANIMLGGQMGASSSISGVGTGIYLNATTNALLNYGDGEAAIDTGSSISASTAINASNAPAVGTYDFRDVSFLGSPGTGFGLGKIYFVAASAGGNGSGSDGANPMTLAAAELLATAQDMIVLVNNGSAISAAGSNGNNSLVLASNVQVRGFGNGVGGGAGTGSAPIVVALTVPSTILLSGGSSVSIADPTGNGAATLTSAAGANAITLGATGNRLSGFILDGGGAVSRGIKDNGAGATNTFLDYLTVRNFGTMGIEITPSTNTTIDHVAFSGNPGGDLLLNAANSVLTNIISNGGGITLNNATGTTTLTNVNLTGGAGLVFTNAAGTINATNVDITNPLVAALTISGGTASFNFDSTSSVTKSAAGAALSIGGGHNTGTFAYAGTLNITGGTGLQFDNADGTYNFTGTTTLAGGDAGIDILNGSSGTFSFGANTSITSPAGTAFNVSGSTAAITYSGNITQANNAALVSFLNHSGGTVTFQTGTLNATNGTGLQFDNADATYNFNGTTTLAGGDAGVDILNGSGGAFTFGTGTSITSPTGVAFNVSGSTAAVTYSGNITQANNAALVNVLNHSVGTLTFQTGTLGATNGTGLQFNNADGTYNFTGATTLNGGDAGIDIINGSDGTFGFGALTAVTHAAAGDAFVLTDSNSNLTYSGIVSDANGYAVRIDNHDAGTVTFDGSSVILASGVNALGLSVSNNGGGTVSFNGNTTLSTQANNAITLTNNAGSTVGFSSVGSSLGITTTSGTAFTIANGGTINVQGPNNTITTGSGTILDISNTAGVSSTLNLNFANASNTLGANGILFTRTAGTLTGSVTINSGAITASSRGIDVSGGTLSLDYAGNVATSGTLARSVEVTNITGGAISVSGNLTDNSLGINIANNSGGSINFYGQSITLNTVANVNAVTLASNTGTNITFSSAAGGNGVDITASGTGNGIDFTGGGSLIVYSTGNSIQTATGQILNLANGNVGSLGLVFDSLSSTGSTNGSAINISNVDGTGTLSATTVSIAGTTGATADGIFYGGGSAMNVNLGTVTIANTGDEGIEINGAGNGTFTAGSVAINNTAGNGVEINGSTNTVNLAAGAIGATNDPTGFGVYVLNGTGAISIASSITKTTGNNVVFVDNHETGNVSFSGAISATGGFNNGIVVQNVNSGTVSFTGNTTLSTGANTAVNLLNNTGGTISFPNGGLVITTNSGTGFSATGGGTVTTSSSGNRITSTTGTALNIVNTTIGAAGLRFQSISSNGASSGIILNNTGTSGGINVTGTGAAGSGGTIQNSSGDGISLTSTENVRLAYMNVTNNLGDGIGGSNINGFLIDNMLISGNGNDAGTDESGINITELTGTASGGARPTGIFNSTIQNNNEFEVQITNSTGTLTNFQVVNSTFASNGVGINGNGTSPHGNIFNFLGTGTSAMGVSVSGSNFTGNWNAASPPATIVGSGLFTDSTGTSMTVQVSGSFFTNTNNGVNVSTGPGSTTLTYSIDGSTFTGTRSTAINDFQNGNSPFTRTVNGRITNNIIGNNAVTNSGSYNGAGISIGNEGAVNARYLISGNTIQQIQTSQGIVLNVGLVGQATGNLTTNATIANNIIRNINGSRGLLINNNQNTGGFPTVNVSVSGNTFSGIAGQAGNGQYMRFAATGGGTINITQGQASASAIASELDDANGFNDPTKISIGTGTFNWNQAAPALPPAVVPLP